MTKNKPANISIVAQGAPIVNDGIITRKYSDLSLVYIDMKSKYCEVTTYVYGKADFPKIYISAGNRGIHLDETKHKEDFTIVKLDDFFGWDIVSADCSRYSLVIVLGKKIYG